VDYCTQPGDLRARYDEVRAARRQHSATRCAACVSRAAKAAAREPHRFGESASARETRQRAEAEARCLAILADEMDGVVGALRALGFRLAGDGVERVTA
jgi:hypothetical protein